MSKATTMHDPDMTLPMGVPDPGVALPMRRVEGSTEITRLIDKALDKGVTVEAMEKLVALHERVADRQAAQEFADAKARFQRECPPIKRATRKTISTKGGASFPIRYAELDEISRTVQPILHQLGLSYSWDTKIEGNMMVSTCTLRHVNSHQESSSFPCPVESANPGMSEQHKYGGANTYARRQSLVQVLGLTSADPDNIPDAPAPGEMARITESQAADLLAKIEEVGADKGRFLKLMAVDRVEDLVQANLTIAHNHLEAKRRR